MSVLNFGELQFEGFALFVCPFDVIALERFAAACIRFVFFSELSI